MTTGSVPPASAGVAAGCESAALIATTAGGLLIEKRPAKKAVVEQTKRSSQNFKGKGWKKVARRGRKAVRTNRPHSSSDVTN